MPEYLAPAVYVEEVSFRSKPLEGVSTSTTAFVGPTTTGPIDDIPELITGVGDFERVYGATTDLSFGLNYLAHSVRAFFDNGGRRLYIARTFQPGTGPSEARSAFLMSPDGAAPNARAVARFPGRGGNGQLRVREERTPTSRAALERAQQGAMIRIGVNSAATPSVALGQRPPFALQNDARMLLTIGGVNSTITFSGQSAQVSGTPDFSGGPLVVDEATPPLRVRLGGVVRTLTIPLGTYNTIQELANALNVALVGGFVIVSGADLILGNEVRGTASSVTILEGEAFGFTNDDSNSRADSTDTVPDLGRVTAADLAAALEALPVTVSVGLDGRLRISTNAVGTSATLTVDDVAGSPSAAEALGLSDADVTPGTGSTPPRLFVKRGTSFVDSANAALPADPLNGIEFLSLNVVAIDADGQSKNFEDLGYDPNHPRYVGSVFGAVPPRRSDQLENRFALTINADTNTVSWPFTLRSALLGGGSENVISLSEGNDGAEPLPERYVEALDRLRSIEDISIVAAPGSSAFASAAQIRSALVTFVERSRAYQIAVLDTPPGSDVGSARQYRAALDSKYAALYHPWVRVANPDLRPGDISTPREIDVPPSGFVCGIYARNDTERGVHKAPANEVVRGAVSLESFVNFAQQEVLNPSGINALRFFPGRGFRVWGARLASSDPEWKYVSLRRYFNFIEASIDRGTQWVVFEPNGPRLWQRVRSTVSDFLFNEWRNGALLGNAPGEAYFVRVDRATMTQNDLDNGRLIVEIGIAVVAPAEFVIFRIGQKTSDARS